MEQVVRSLPQAFRIIKEMDLFGDAESDYRSSGRESLREILEDRMRDRIDRHLGDTERYVKSAKRKKIERGSSGYGMAQRKRRFVLPAGLFYQRRLVSRFVRIVLDNIRGPEVCCIAESVVELVAAGCGIDG